ncbi:hypothetical protein LXA43DRAFT_672077 [Ganoderma leucocontextum]|nr:hypothetical protein LXA43DRAFT_672077 [Ganoderma leucocontextum]
MRFYGSPIVKALRRNAPQQQPLYAPILPLEVIERIFVLACEEDGAVARSLSVVCKAAHSVAKYAARFDTVTLRSGTEREVRRCVSLLGEARAASATRRDWVARPAVRHLCVLITPTDAWRLMYDNLRKPYRAQPSRATDETFAIRDGLNDAIQVLFLQVAPDLETLCVLRIPGDWDDRRWLPSDIDTIRYGRGFGGFPKLRDVLFDGNLEFKPSQDGSGTHDDSEAGGGNPHGSLFPALRRMHVAPCWSANIGPFDRWMDEAPALESLRFTISFSMTSGERKCPTLPPWLVQFGSTMSQALSRFGGKCSAISCNHHLVQPSGD